MEPSRLRCAFDANVIVAGIRWPRWPHEVLRAALTDTFDFILPEQVIDEGRRHLPDPADRALLDAWLAESKPVVLPRPSVEAVRGHRDLVRDDSDTPLALTLLEGNVDVFVTNDRDFTDPYATAAHFREHVGVMLPAVFLRDIMGWTSERLEQIRYRTWEDLLPWD
jgi:predicted nucleic acid-binding protein